MNKRATESDREPRVYGSGALDGEERSTPDDQTTTVMRKDVYGSGALDGEERSTPDDQTTTVMR